MLVLGVSSSVSRVFPGTPGPFWDLWWRFFVFSRRRQVRTQRETSLGEVEFSRRASVVEVTEGKFWS